MVANFGDKPLRASKGQVVGLAEAAHSFPVCAVTATEQNEYEADWTEQILQTVSHLTDKQKGRLFDTLRPQYSIWDGRLGEISAVQHHMWHNGRKGGCQYWDGWGEPGAGVPSGGDELAISQFSPRLGWVDRYTVAVGLYDPASVSLTGD